MRNTKRSAIMNSIKDLKEINNQQLRLITKLTEEKRKLTVDLGYERALTTILLEVLQKGKFNA